METTEQGAAKEEEEQREEPERIDRAERDEIMTVESWTGKIEGDFHNGRPWKKT